MILENIDHVVTFDIDFAAVVAAAAATLKRNGRLGDADLA